MKFVFAAAALALCGFAFALPTSGSSAVTERDGAAVDSIIFLELVLPNADATKSAYADEISAADVKDVLGKRDIAA
jgi:hypothetical protein